MTYDEFKDAVKNEIKLFLPSEYRDAEVTIDEVIKNNDVRRDALHIRKPDSIICPNIYLNGIYASYSTGYCPLNEYLEDIADRRVEAEKMIGTLGAILPDGICDYEMVKDLIQPKLQSFEWNEEYLMHVPHMKFLDMAVTFFIDLGNGESGQRSIPVTKHLLEIWSRGLSVPVTPGFLFELSKWNLEADRILPSVKELKPEPNPMYVLTRKDVMYGASVILHDRFMDDVSSIIGGDFYILPSSVNEVIATPFVQNDYKWLENMVFDINRTMVSMQERLSDRVYRYDHVRKEILLADDSLNMAEKNDMEEKGQGNRDIPDFSLGGNRRLAHVGGR